MTWAWGPRTGTTRGAGEQKEAAPQPRAPSLPQKTAADTPEATRARGLLSRGLGPSRQVHPGWLDSGPPPDSQPWSTFLHGPSLLPHHRPLSWPEVQTGSAFSPLWQKGIHISQIKRIKQGDVCRSSGKPQLTGRSKLAAQELCQGAGAHGSVTSWVTSGECQLLGARLFFLYTMASDSACPPPRDTYGG